jgi:hypothetical protein
MMENKTQTGTTCDPAELLVRIALSKLRHRWVKTGGRKTKKTVKMIRKVLWMGANIPHFIQAGFEEDEVRGIIFPIYKSMPERFHAQRAMVVADRKKKEAENGS